MHPADHAQHLHSIIAAVRRATDPFELVRLAGPPERNWGVLSIGKAAPAMDAAVPNPLERRLLITTDGTPLWGDPAYAELVDHPLPTDRNLRATERALRWIDAAKAIATGDDAVARLDRVDPDALEELRAAAADVPQPAEETDTTDRVIPLVLMLSGGASACLASPMPGLTVQHLRDATQALLRAGCPIDELNVVRKHIELLKGGRLARHAAPLPLRVLVLSDVVSGDVSAVGSGPAAPDTSTYADAIDVLRRFDALDVVPAVTRFLEDGARGERPETVRPDDPCWAAVATAVVGDHRVARHAAVEAASALGFHAHARPEPLAGEAAHAARALVDAARALRARVDGPCALIATGETTVNVGRARGLGGRNQELALAAALELDGDASLALAAFATDGIDGPTDAAGAIIAGDTATRMRAEGVDPAAALRGHASHAALDAASALLRTGPTGTNVNDLAVLLAY